MEQIIPEAMVPRKPALPEGEAGSAPYRRAARRDRRGPTTGVKQACWEFPQRKSNQKSSGTEVLGKQEALAPQWKEINNDRNYGMIDSLTAPVEHQPKPLSSFSPKE